MRLVTHPETRGYLVSLLLTVCALVVIYGLPYTFPFLIVKGVIGSIFVLLVPGYVLLTSIVEKALPVILTLACSVVLSIVIAYVTGVLANFLFWRIERDYVTLMLSIFVCSVALAGIYQKRNQITES